MRVLCCTSNCRGQALVEALFSLPTLVAGVTLVLVGLHSLFVFHVADAWTYEAALCLAKEHPVTICQQQFEKRGQLLLFAKLRWEQTEQGRLQVGVTSTLQSPLLHKSFHIRFPRHLSYQDFRSF